MPCHRHCPRGLAVMLCGVPLFFGVPSIAQAENDAPASGISRNGGFPEQSPVAADPRCDPGVQQVTCQEDRAFSRDLLKKAAGLAILSRVAHRCDSPLAPDLAVRASVSSWIEATASVAG